MGCFILKVLVGCIYHESNTFNPFPTDLSGFVILEGNDMLSKLASVQIFEDHGFEVVPSIFASGLPSGTVKKETYELLTSKIMKTLENETDIDGIWLHFHGSMNVEEVGSGELALLKEIRKVVGSTTPISIALDIHANVSNELHKYANIIRSYRTVPHIDQAETEIITAKLLVDSLINNKQINPVYKKLPIVIGGDTAIDSHEPLKSIFNRLNEIESLPGILSASFFIGFSWADTDHTGSSIIIVPESNSYKEMAINKAEELANYIDNRKHEFKFQSLALNPYLAVKKALDANCSPVFISDTGDNTTGGAAGINTELLKITLDMNNPKDKKICIAAIFDESAYEICSTYSCNDLVKLKVGIDYDKYSESVAVEGILKAKGDLLGFTSDKVGKTCTLSVGNIDLVIANKAESFITIDHFKAAGLKIEDYDVVVVKQGYLFPELTEVAELSIFALTQGATYQYFYKLPFKHIPENMYPFNDDKITIFNENEGEL